MQAFIQRHPVSIYFILTFAISWGAILVAAGPSQIPLSTELRMTLGALLVLGPSIASMLLTGLVSGSAGYRELLARLLKWRVDGRWYAVALLIAPVSTAIVLGVLAFLSPEFLPTIFISIGKVTLVLTGIVVGLMVGLFEELGWTGFAIPRLRLRYNVMGTGLMAGFLWGAWHFMMFWESDSFAATLPLALMLARLFSWLPAYRILMVWVYDRTESLLVAILMHASLVATTLIVDPVLSGSALLKYILIHATVYWIIAGIAQRVTTRRTESGWP